ncbi:WhiB family transcriptional regulator [Rhodococcus jostii]|uniref:WhiB family transcriptional regulator n=1 Tax=Rhodococcus jostii TaxID=132919 RepID=UPI003665E99B
MDSARDPAVNRRTTQEGKVMLREQNPTVPALSPNEWEWRQHARCRYFDADLFFDPADDSTDEHAAKAICNHCPVLAHCRDYAVDAKEPHGIWGGLSPTERKRQRWFNRFKTTPTVPEQRCS